jgi:hypothetical protein
VAETPEKAANFAERFFFSPALMEFFRGAKLVETVHAKLSLTPLNSISKSLACNNLAKCPASFWKVFSSDKTAPQADVKNEID